MLCFMGHQCFAMVDVNQDLSDTVKMYINAASQYQENFSTLSNKKRIAFNKAQQNRLKSIKKLVIKQGATVSQQLLNLAKDTPNLKGVLEASPKLREKFLEKQIFVDFSKGLDQIAQNE